MLGGYPMVDVKCEILDGSYHEVDSSEIAFKLAGSFAFKEAARKAGAILLEPIMDVEIITSEEYMGDVIGDVNSRRGRVRNIENRTSSVIVHCSVPLAEMFGYSTALRSLTRGRASYSMEPMSFEKVPENILAEILDTKTTAKTGTDAEEMNNQRIRIRLKGYDHRVARPVGPRHRRDGQTHGREGRWADPVADRHLAALGEPLAARGQEVHGTV